MKPCCSRDNTRGSAAGRMQATNENSLLSSVERMIYDSRCGQATHTNILAQPQHRDNRRVAVSRDRFVSREQSLMSGGHRWFLIERFSLISNRNTPLRDNQGPSFVVPTLLYVRLGAVRPAHRTYSARALISVEGHNDVHKPARRQLCMSAQPCARIAEQYQGTTVCTTMQIEPTQLLPAERPAEPPELAAQSTQHGICRHPIGCCVCGRYMEENGHITSQHEAASIS